MCGFYNAYKLFNEMPTKDIYMISITVQSDRSTISNSSYLKQPFSPPDPSLKILKIKVENEQDDGDELDINKETSEFGVILKLVGNIGERPPDLTMVIFTGSSPLSSIPIYKPTLLTGMLFTTNPVVTGSINEVNTLWDYVCKLGKINPTLILLSPSSSSSPPIQAHINNTQSTSSLSLVPLIIKKTMILAIVTTHHRLQHHHCWRSGFRYCKSGVVVVDRTNIVCLILRSELIS
ncbi:hypothetical protein QVD17_19708 [Tagetes erecta]|uniref:Uncharacterized protein n=1 Tax=Tagetes erecta TaxID=13708 RepID=A0AAD8KJW7_TARER|nr:hypothetical protein QVD17_19708 [Tagetes erecta]